jgi:sulfite reductase (NADPH) flavoprotein alpha-component
MMAAKKKNGAKLIVVDPRKTPTAEKADLFLPIKPGTDLALLNGLLHLIVQAGQISLDFIADNTLDWDNMVAFLADYTPEKVSEITGLAAEDICTAAKWMGEAPELMSLWTMGLNQSTHGTWQTNAICNLHLATGKICRPGSGPFSLTGQPNAMGGREVGYLSSGLPGQRSVANASDRAFVEKLWNLPQGSLKSEPGLDAITLFKKMEAGEVKALWVIGTNPVVTVPARAGVAKALEKAELVIVQDVYFPTETGKYADVLLPGAVWAEAEGTMTNSERVVTLMQKAVEPPGDALPDWELVTRIAREMGFEAAFPYKTASEVFDEIRATVNPFTGYDLRGISYEKLRSSAMQWPCGPEEVVGKSIRYVNQKGKLQFPTQTGRAHFFTRPFLPPVEMPDAEYPMILTTGRVLNQWHTMTKTGKVDQLNKLNPGPFLELHPEDAAQLKIADKQQVEVKSRRGSGFFPAKITMNIRQGTCFAPFHWNDSFGENIAINAVTNDAYDAISKQPETKFCAVNLIPDTPKPNMTIETELSEGVTQRGDGPFTPAQKEYLQGLITGMMITGSIPDHLRHGLPENSPFNAAQRSWLSGLLAGVLAKKNGQ